LIRQPLDQGAGLGDSLFYSSVPGWAGSKKPLAEYSCGKLEDNPAGFLAGRFNHGT